MNNPASAKVEAITRINDFVVKFANVKRTPLSKKKSAEKSKKEEVV